MQTENANTHTSVIYAADVRSMFPLLCSGALSISGIDSSGDPTPQITRLSSIAESRLKTGNESEFPEIQAWRRAFAAMGLKPTQYRCASEVLLRRYRKDGTIPKLHPLIDLCNAASLAFAIPIAVFDAEKLVGSITVRPAIGDELYETFSETVEQPEPGEIIFADAANRPHARRWTNGQSGWSPVRLENRSALLITEALHKTSEEDVSAFLSVSRRDLLTIWPKAKVMEMSPHDF